MTRETHETHVVALRRWAGTVSDRADVVINSDPTDTRWTCIHITPKRTDLAAPILLRIDQSRGRVCLYASALRFEARDDWSRVSYLNICAAILAGRLTDTLRLWRGRETGRSTFLKLDDAEQPIAEDEIGSVWDGLLKYFGTLIPGATTRVVRYAPFTPANKSLHATALRRHFSRHHTRSARKFRAGGIGGT